MKKLLLLITLLPSISLANELYMQCTWDGYSDSVFDYHYSKKGGLNLVKSWERQKEDKHLQNLEKAMMIAYEKGDKKTAKRKAEQMQAYSISIAPFVGEVNYKKSQCKVIGVNLVCKKTESKGNTNIAHSTAINRFTLLLEYSYEKTEVVDGITDPTSINDKANCVEVKAKL
ncbi:hypothetical protein N9A22_04000 [Methylophilaceae bacterium]|nr:hypothetical protein [Methylophilaceae bacterium]